jgi:hypothetical protein
MKNNNNKKNIILSIWKTAEEDRTHWESCQAVATKRLKPAVIWFLQIVEVVNSIEFLL